MITAVVVEGRSQAEVARTYEVSKGWVSRLVARYRLEGEAAFEPRSRRPHTSPAATPAATVELVLALRKQLTDTGRDAGADTIVWHLQHDHQVRLSRASAHRILTRHGTVIPEPRKRPRASWIRFQAAMPNECWQSDFTHYPLTDGTDTEIITWLDDCSRYLLHVSAHTPVTAKTVLATFRTAAQEFGYPASTLTDNGMVYTVRLASHARRGGRTALEAELRRLHITQKNSRPNHPTTCGKVERVQQTLKKWLRAQPDQPATIEQLQALIDAFVDDYNHHRPHRSLPHRAVPAAIYTTRPKAVPTQTSISDSHDRVRHDRIDKDGKLTLRVNGRLHHIGIGRTHARTPVILLIHDLHVRVVDATTGELLRELLLDPTRDYQPLTPDTSTSTSTSTSKDKRLNPQN